MKILFLCGSLELGYDGVGDYTRRLACELVQKGHEVKAISLKEKSFLQEKEEIQILDGIELSVVRIPSNASTNKLKNFLERNINAFDPHWISFQFVIYAYHPKGLPFYLPGFLKSIRGNFKWHIMFHEIWIGFTSISPIKHKVVGSIQKRIIKKIVSSIQPKSITTTNLLYQAILKRSNTNTTIINLFSNIDISPLTSAFSNFVLKKLSIAEGGRKDWIILGIFGNLYPEAKLEPTLNFQYNQALESSKKVAFIGFGRMNDDGMKEFLRLENIFVDKISFLHLGERNEDEISQLLQMLDIGISCTPSQHIGKSGVFAAMKYHGLHVILPNGDFIPEYEDVIQQNQNILMKKPSEQWGASYISNRYNEIFLNR
ncbi:hypothetical protein [Cognataquiflexum rubidum]|uniref:hypothetical protein n=1 Tax=Cognataquiflexum rubidum TaxID=2922273 RepID=UPI001F12AC66|nr:hypothetical protein [Cognataquiflexum rubidum]MCH6234033.1 hypothetical protein [Cognataquiflexum rubidum]